MHVPHQTVLIIHEERVNELLSKKLEDYDNGLVAGMKRLMSNLRDALQDETLPRPNAIEAAPRRNHRTTQELAMVGKK